MSVSAILPLDFGMGVWLLKKGVFFQSAHMYHSVPPPYFIDPLDVWISRNRILTVICPGQVGVGGDSTFCHDEI